MVKNEAIAVIQVPIHEGRMFLLLLLYILCCEFSGQNQANVEYKKLLEELELQRESHARNARSSVEQEVTRANQRCEQRVHEAQEEGPESIG